MKKQVMKIEMYDRTIVVYHTPGQRYEFKVYELKGMRNPYHLDSFESFQEASEFAIAYLYQ